MMHGHISQYNELSIIVIMIVHSIIIKLRLYFNDLKVESKHAEELTLGAHAQRGLQ